MCEPQHRVSLLWCRGGTLAHPPAGSSAGAASAFQAAFGIPTCMGTAEFAFSRLWPRAQRVLEAILGSFLQWPRCLLLQEWGSFWEMVKFQSQLGLLVEEIKGAGSGRHSVPRGTAGTWWLRSSGSSSGVTFFNSSIWAR